MSLDEFSLQKYVVQELFLFYLKTVTCASSINKSSWTLPGNIILVFLAFAFLWYTHQSIYKQLSSITELPSWSVRASLISTVRLGDYIAVWEEPSVIPCVCVCVYKQQKPCPHPHQICCVESPNFKQIQGNVGAGE